MFEKYVYLTLIKGGREKENQSQQIPTFRCSEWSNFKDLHCKDLLLSPHKGYVASTCPVHCLIWVFNLLLAVMLHPRHQPFKWEGGYI